MPSNKSKKDSAKSMSEFNRVVSDLNKPSNSKPNVMKPSVMQLSQSSLTSKSAQTKELQILEMQSSYAYCLLPSNFFDFALAKAKRQIKARKQAGTVIQ